MDFFFRYNMSNIIRHKKKMELKLVWEHSGHFHCRVHSDSLAVFTLFCSPEQCVYAVIRFSGVYLKEMPS